MINDSIKARAARSAQEEKADHLVVGAAPKRPVAPPQQEHKTVNKEDNKKLAKSVLDELRESLK